MKKKRLLRRFFYGCYMTPHIAWCTNEDIDDLIALDARGSNVPFGRQGLEGALGQSVTRCLLARNEQEDLLAFLLFHLIQDEAHILNIVVDEPERRQGIARLLMNSLMKLPINTIYLEVRSRNTAARYLYEGLGFVQAGKRKNYYLSPVDDALLMTWVGA